MFQKGFSIRASQGFYKAWIRLLLGFPRGLQVLCRIKGLGFSDLGGESSFLSHESLGFRV